MWSDLLRPERCESTVTLAIWRVGTGKGALIARGDSESGPAELLDPSLSITSLLSDPDLNIDVLADLEARGTIPGGSIALAPIDAQPVWAAGVTYARSRSARMEESRDAGDVYDRVYAAQRPELFFKSAGEDAVGPDGSLGIRADS